jgi:hypothetical protein
MTRSRYGAPGFASPQWSSAPVPVLAIDDANGQRVVIAATNTAEDADPLPVGCDMALVTNLGANVVHVRGDGVDATSASLPILPESQRDVVVTDAARVISLFGTEDDVVVISPYLAATA